MSPTAEGAVLWRATIAHTPRDPFGPGRPAAVVVRDGGLLVSREGRILALDSFEKLAAHAAGARIEDRRGSWILPGLVDLHVHFPQSRIVASRGGELLDWLERYVFPEEQRLADADYAADVARLFCGELLRNGTTTALVFGSHDARATDLCFREGARRGLRLVLGKVLHGEGVPAPMRDDPRRARDECRALIADWHGRGKMRYAVTPRFALTSTPDTFALCRELIAGAPGLAVTTHVSENRTEIVKTSEKFPEARDYVDVYARAGLLGPRTVLAHGIYLSDAERATLVAERTAVAHCPSSNFFLGSGVFAARATRDAGLRVGLGTDVGAGTSFSLFNECDHAYKASALAGAPLVAAELLWLATMGGAEALGSADEIGDFTAGKSADFVVLDPRRDFILNDRLARAGDDDADSLFALLTLARGPVVAEVVIDGGAAAPSDQIAAR